MKFYDWAGGVKVGVKFQHLGDKLAIAFPYNENLKNDIKGCEGARWNPEHKCWIIKHPEYSPRNKFVLGLLTNGEMYPLDNRYKRGRMHLEPNRKVRSNQQEIINNVLTFRRFLIAAEMGAGKTLAIIECMEHALSDLERVAKGGQLIINDKDESYVISDIKDHSEFFWVVAPKSALRAWAYELKKWDAIVRPQLIVASHRGIERAMDNARFPPYFLCVDESSLFKNSQAQRTKLMITLSGLMSQTWQTSEYVVPMTGTPAPKEPSDWWSQIEITMPGYLREKSTAELKRRLAYMDTVDGPHGSYSKVTGWNVEEVKALARRLDPIRVIQYKKDIVDLPDKLYNEIKIPVSPSELSALKVLVSQSDNAAQALIKARELSDGFQYEHDLETDTRNTSYVKTPKDEILIERLETNNEVGRIVIFAGFKASVDKVRELTLGQGWSVIQVDGRGWKTYDNEGQPLRMPQEDMLAYFQDSEEPKVAFIGNPESGGMGLTLTRASEIVYYSNTFKAQDRMQSEDRIHRPGMDLNRGAIITDLLWLPTDKLVLDNLKAKRELQSLTMEEVEASLTQGTDND